MCSIFSGLLVTDLTDTAVASWWDLSWNYYQEITIDSSYVAENHWNYPLLVTIPDATGDKCDGGDSIRFVGLSNGSTGEFYYEIEKWVDGSDRIVWVNISETITSGSDYTFLMYYNNTAAADNQTATGVWDSNFNAVYHMGESSATIGDSTSNVHNALTTSGTPIYSRTGKTGDAIYYFGGGAGSGESHTIPDTVLTNAQAEVGYTIEFWYHPANATALYYQIIDLSDDTEIILNVNNNTGTMNFMHDTHDDGDTSQKLWGTQIIGDGHWYYLTATYNGSHKAVYTNSTDRQKVAEGSIDSEGQANKIGANIGDNWGADGEVDEVRISKKCRNQSWINLTYHSQNQTTGFLTFGGEKSQAITAPVSFTATTLSITSINLSWTMGTNATHTRIQRQTGSYPTTRSDGTNIYNSTGTSYIDSSLTSYIRYYYSAWSYNSTTGAWSGVTTDLNNTGPASPTNISTVIVENDLNISWIAGTDADTTHIQRKINSYPTSPTDGTTIYNNTGLFYVDTNVLQTYHYTLYSWDNNTNLYSSGVNLEWGALIVNCYDEETNESLYFDIFVFNQDGSQTYESKNNSNPLYIDIADNLPLGDKIGIQINPAQNYSEKTETFTYQLDENRTITYVILAQVPESKATTNVTCTKTAGGNTYPAFTLDADFITILAGATTEFDKITVNYTHDEYESRMYYRDLEANQISTLDAYLPRAADKELYKLIVLNQFDSPVEEAYVQIKRPIGGTYLVISSLYTDASGRIDIYLIPEEHYKVIISKSGYDTATSDFTPPQIIYAEDRTHIFRLNFETPPEEPEINIWDIITFDAYFLENDNNTLYVTYQDSSGNSTQVQIRIYQNGTDLLYNTTFPNNNSFTIEWTEANHTLYDYLVRLDIYNHSDLDDQSSNIMIPKAIPSKQQFKFDLEIDLGSILGDLEEHPIGWLNCVVFFFGVFIVVTFGKYWAGLALMALGLILGFFEIIIGLPGFTGPQFAAIAFMILFGFLVEVAKYKKTVRL